jgi:hypothetical protein
MSRANELLKSSNLRDPTEAEIKQIAATHGLNLAEAYRPKRAYPILGWRHSQTFAHIASGEIEAPLPLSESGSAVAWTGYQLACIIWRRQQMAAAKKKQVVTAY